MIAIEMLLTHRGDKYSEMLPLRAEAFIGWAAAWTNENYKERIQSLYKKRSDFVHRGLRDDIKIADLLFSDTLLWNVLVNILKHPQIFDSRASVIEFSEKVAAEKKLGIETTVTPKTFTFINPRYNDRDLRQI